MLSMLCCDFLLGLCCAVKASCEKRASINKVNTSLFWQIHNDWRKSMSWVCTTSHKLMSTSKSKKFPWPLYYVSKSMDVKMWREQVLSQPKIIASRLNTMIESGTTYFFFFFGRWFPFFSLEWTKSIQEASTLSHLHRWITEFPLDTVKPI